MIAESRNELESRNQSASSERTEANAALTMANGRPKYERFFPTIYDSRTSIQGNDPESNQSFSLTSLGSIGCLAPCRTVSTSTLSVSTE